MDDLTCPAWCRTHETYGQERGVVAVLSHHSAVIDGAELSRLDRIVIEDRVLRVHAGPVEVFIAETLIPVGMLEKALAMLAA